MGNISAHDLQPIRQEERRGLDISRSVSRRQYLEHAAGNYSSQCLADFPGVLLETLSLHERLDASFNAITSVPDVLPLRLPHLTSLRLSHNAILHLPDSFALFFHLRSLALDHNRLSELPATFSRLVKLETLDLSHNALSALPDDIGALDVLVRLNASNNRLRSLPSSLARCSALAVLLARGNRLVTPSQEVCDAGSGPALASVRKLGSAAGGATPPRRRRTVPVDFPRVGATPGATENRASAQARYADSLLFPANKPRTPLIAPLGASALDACELRDRIVGLFYGAAIGDALGVATEHLSADECSFYYDPADLAYSSIVRDEYRTRWKRGDWTTDFDQIALVLDSLLRWAGVVDELDFASRLAHWNAHGFPELGDKEGVVFSNTITKVCEHSLFLTDPHAAAKQLARGAASHEKDGSEETDEFLDEYADDAALARSIVLGIPSFYDLREATENSARICRSTHSDSRCVAAAATVSSCVALLLQGSPGSTSETMTQLILKAKESASQYLSHDEQMFDTGTDLSQCISTSLTKSKSQHFVLRSLKIALAAVQTHNDYRSTITSIVMQGGHCKTAACVAGALQGCRYGYSKLPAPWVNDLCLKQTEWLNTKLNWLLDIMGIP